MWIGKQHGGSAFEFHGQIDEVRLWRVARSQTQIEADMNKEVDPNTQSLGGYWKFNEGQGTTIHDATVNHNDGVLKNNVGWVEGKL